MAQGCHGGLGGLSLLQAISMAGDDDAADSDFGCSENDTESGITVLAH